MLEGGLEGSVVPWPVFQWMKIRIFEIGANSLAKHKHYHGKRPKSKCLVPFHQGQGKVFIVFLVNPESAHIFIHTITNSQS